MEVQQLSLELAAPQRVTQPLVVVAVAAAVALEEVVQVERFG